VDWRLVRINSSGDMVDVMAERASMPAARGNNGPVGRIAGRETFRR